MIAWSLEVKSQEPAFLHYGVQDGLPGNVVYCGLQDSKGLLWFGTDKGLACFDGTRFHTFGMADGLPDPEILNLKEDVRGRLWISCFRKEPSYRWQGRIYNATTDTSLALVDFEIGMADFYTEGDSVWFAGLETDVYRYDNKGMHAFNLKATGARFGRIDGKLFVFGTNEIMEYRSDNDIPVVFTLQKEMGRIRGYSGFSISGNLVLYSWYDKLILIEWKNDHFEQLDVLPGTSGQVFTDHQGNFWVCSPSEGAYCFFTKNKNLKHAQRYLAGIKTTAMFEDHQRTRWFCTAGQGIYALPANAAVNYTQLTEPYSSNITAVFSQPNGTILAGDDEGNIHSIGRDNSVKTIQLGAVDGYSRCRKIIGHTDGSVWYATDEGLFSQKSGIVTYLDEITPGIKDILYADNKMWFATFSRVGYVPIDSRDFRFLFFRRFTNLGADSDGCVWAGGIDGLYSLRDTFVYNWGETFPKLRNRISAIANAGGPYMWVANLQDGLLRLTVDKGRVTALEVINDSLQSTPIHNIQSMYQEPGGRLWVATNRGVYGIDKRFRVVRYDHRDGLADNDVNTLVVTGDTLWVGTVAGLTRLKMLPDTLESEFHTLVSALRYHQGEKVISDPMFDAFSAKDSVFRLPIDATLISLELAGLDFLSSGALRYSCVLSQRLPPIGHLTIDNLTGWLFNGFKPKTESRSIETGSFNFGIKLPPGYYELEATAVNSRGVKSKHPARFALLMPARWYETIWFWLLVWGGLAYLFYRAAQTRSAMHRLRASISELQLQALQSQINPHFIGNAINSIQQFFYPPDPAKASVYVSLLTRLLRRTLEFSETAYVRFGDEVAYDTDYLELNRLRFGERLAFNITGSSDIDPGTPFPSMMLQPLLENATIHGIAPEGQTVLNLHFERQGEYLVCTLTDNGIGINAMKLRPNEHGRTSKGLLMLHKKVETLNQLYNVNMSLHANDLGEKPAAGPQGTRVVLTYEPAAFNRKSGLKLTGLVDWVFKKYHYEPKKYPRPDRG